MNLRKTLCAAIGIVVHVITISGQTDHQEGRYGNLVTDNYLGEVEIVARIEDEKIFTEGPAVDRKGHVY